MEHLATALKALGHPERLRIVALLSRGELTVSEITQVLGLSQPRVTQYIKTLEAAGVVQRLKEGSWVFSRLKRSDVQTVGILDAVITALPQDDGDITADRRRLESVRANRAKAATEFFADLAQDKDNLSAEYLPRGDIESHMRAMAGPGPFNHMVDLGTGTGRILKVFADIAKRGTGIDSNHDMLRVARPNLAQTGFHHLSVQAGDLTQTPLNAGTADLVTLHQVLHFLDDPDEAIREAARLLGDNGKLLIVDFAAHDRDEFRDSYAHRRLGFDSAEISAFARQHGLTVTEERKVKPQDDAPAVMLWLAVKSTENKGSLQ
ncbi:ArsR/SmtB family transcription factor [Robiginitomaculum antarcticum]|uniref:ArsR/SmtB family transcription factor n=1 Tax=Robiginitomaculum antarcticum TaxID=437507 RepID=UPI00035C8D09|nr:metalloregulator ArsR/SmtB family transcription factor [Robiginitomaculum antarcticum]